MPPKKANASNASSTSKPSKRAKLDPAHDSNNNNDSRVLSKEEEEEMSSALIAQLLAQEGGGDHHGYYAEYNNDANYDRASGRSVESSDDDEDYRLDGYRPKKSRKAAKSAPIRKKAKQAPAPTPKPTKASKASKEPTVSITSTALAGTTSTTTALASQTDNTQSVAKVETTPSPTTTTITITNSKINSAAPPPAPAAPAPKKPKEMPTGINTGVYSAEEERAFVEALELFGRNWRKVEEHVKTRDSNSIRSHAQKHFIKLFRDNIPLPARMLETGPGYTLSGRDLDPYSAAALPYLSQRHFDDPTLLPKQGGQIFMPPDSMERKAEKAEKAAEKLKREKEKEKERSSKAAKDPVEDGAADATKELKELKIRKSTRTPKESSKSSGSDSPSSMESTATFAPVGRTDYSKARLRSSRERTSINFRNMVANDVDPLTMVKCEPFCGQPNSGVVGCQPFGIKVQSNVLLGMDFHAHLMTTEIIGFLAGTWTPSTKTIHIQAIFPCRSLPTTGQDNHVNVEMDPTSEFEVRQEIEKRKMRVVGWYHSHPTFTPDPSLVDIENQASYQNLFKDESMNEEPFVGAIVGPYDDRLPGLSSVINWFYISHSPQERGHPKRLLYDLVEDTELPEQESDLWVKLFDEYRDSPERTNFQEQWRQEETESKLQKMLVSLGRRMPWLRNTLLKNKALSEMVEEVETDQDKGALATLSNGSSSATTEQAATTPAVVAPVVESAALPSPEGKMVEGTVIAAASGGIVESADEIMSTTADQTSESPLSSSAMEGVESTQPESVTTGPPVESESSAAKATAMTTTTTVVAETIAAIVTTTESVTTEEAMVTATMTANEAEGSATLVQAVQDMERSLSTLSNTTNSSGSSGGGGSRSIPGGFAIMVQDSFLIRVEQELSTWQPVFA
ncbi:hypothetical protein BG004_006211 [Podila humilis]|nr:hypothetical protein BG004_006211 [Podila humilis]